VPKPERHLLIETYLILSTIPFAKGQEWSVVYILKVAMVASRQTWARVSAEQIEEERRVSALP